MRFKLTVLLGCFVLCTVFSSAGINTWTQCTTIGYQPIGFVTLCINPMDENVVYCTNNAMHSKATTLYRSTDKGISWNPISIFPDNIDLLAYSSDTLAMYIFTSFNLLYISKDGGITYYNSTTGMPAPFNFSFLTSYENPSVAYAGFNTVYKTTDQGSTWTTASTGLDVQIGRYVTSIAEDPQNPSNLYTTLYNGYIYKSINGGDAWSLITTGLNPAADIWRSIAIHPNNPNILFAVPERTRVIYKSINRGDTWSPITSGIPYEVEKRVLTFLPSNPSTMFLGCGAEGVFQSIDCGNTWYSFNNGFNITKPVPYQIAITKTKPHTIFMGSDFGLYTYTIVDTGINDPEWQMYDKGLQDGIILKNDTKPTVVSKQK